MWQACHLPRSGACPLRVKHAWSVKGLSLCDVAHLRVARTWAEQGIKSAGQCWMQLCCLVCAKGNKRGSLTPTQACTSELWHVPSSGPHSGCIWTTQRIKCGAHIVHYDMLSFRREHHSSSVLLAPCPVSRPAADRHEHDAILAALPRHTSTHAHGVNMTPLSQSSTSPGHRRHTTLCHVTDCQKLVMALQTRCDKCSGYPRLALFILLQDHPAQPSNHGGHASWSNASSSIATPCMWLCQRNNTQSIYSPTHSLLCNLHA